MKKKALALLMATAMVASLAGCGSKEGKLGNSLYRCG